MRFRRSLVDDEQACDRRPWSPGAENWDSHADGLDYLVVYLTDGILTVEAQGQMIEAPVSRHAVTSRPAGVSHNVAQPVQRARSRSSRSS